MAARERGWPVVPGASAIGGLVIAGAVAAAHFGGAVVDAASRADDDERLLAAHVTELHGSVLPYSVVLPDTGWRAFGDEVLEEAPDAEFWLRRSDVRAELMIIPRTGLSRDTPFAELEQDAITRLVHSGAEVLRGEMWDVARGGRVLHCYARYLDVGETEVLYGFWRRFGVSYVVMLTVPPEGYDAFLPEAQAILAAFDPGPE